MFGYVVAHKPELKMREFSKYKAYYCGLCQMLAQKYGVLGQMTLTYDMTFLIVLLTSLYEPQSEIFEKRCMAHPMQKQKKLVNEVTAYAADMNIILTYHHLADDWQDEKSKAGLVGMQVLKRAYRKLEKQYPKKCEVIANCIQRLHQCEVENEQEIDEVARTFGELMSELFVYQEDMWEDTLRKMGFYLGKFIYIMDAYDDVEKDKKKGNYNVLVSLSAEADFDERCKEMLNYVLAECTHEFEKLPCVEDVEILRNILYAGVWTGFDKRLTKKEKKEEK